MNKFNLRDEYWNSLSDKDRELYHIIRPIPSAAYTVDQELSRVDPMLKCWSDDLESAGGQLELEPDFQRGHVWTPEQRTAYMESFLRGRAPKRILFNCPGWISNHTKGGDIKQSHMQCIDGLQRLTTMRLFMRDEVQVFGGITASLLNGTSFDPRRTGNMFNIAIYEFNTRRDLLQFYLDLNSGGTVHSKNELARVKALLDGA
ncbi:DUF262 domain-containing protein [Comamonas sp. JNW]|uniref:DUF262 domain-containing protein n=1 Tax=Comamonas sp. JNW TaxID=2170731 RepID=UPI000DE7BAE5|nr:DUF262 domain-containing protein [Comamonas sp. JNW]PWB21352.1 hypothetical protein DCO45_02850 [Comamonas sp. JNW]